MNFIKTFNLKLFLFLLFLYIFALLLFIYEGKYINNIHNQPVTDLILSNIPSINLSFLFSFGYFVPQILFLFFILWKKNFNTFFYIYFITIWVFIIRVIFNILTHLEAPSGAVKSDYFPNLFLHNDLFYSGHVAIPFLYFLLYWKLKNKIFASIWLFWTVVMSFTVLLMKVHYSIDVFMVPFVVFAIYKWTDYILVKYFNIKIKEEYFK